MSDKSPRQNLSKSSGQSIKEKRAAKKAKKDDTVAGPFPSTHTGRRSGTSS